jgi:hypothetical protein
VRWLANPIAATRPVGNPGLPGRELGRGVDISLPGPAVGWLTVLRSLAGETP